MLDSKESSALRKVLIFRMYFYLVMRQPVQLPRPREDKNRWIHLFSGKRTKIHKKNSQRQFWIFLSLITILKVVKMISEIFLIDVFVWIRRIISFAVCRGAAMLAVETERPCWERNALLIRLDIRGMGGDGSGVYVQCDAERGDNEACPPLQTFHAISAICCPDCASSSSPMTNWLAACFLSFGLSLWISMCSSSTSVFVSFISFSYSPSYSKCHQSALSPVKTQGVWGGGCGGTDQLMTFMKGRRNRDYSSGPWWASSFSSSRQIIAVPWQL